MQINSATANLAGGKAADGSKTLAGDFETFLSLLTTQLQQQDPLSPMDAEKFTSQLVQFTAVEQSIETNRKLGQLVSLMSGNGTGAALSYIGHEVELDGDSIHRRADGTAQLTLDVPVGARSVDLAIVNEGGGIVRHLNGPTSAGLHRVHWDGLTDLGTEAAAGAYRLVATADTGEGSQQAVPTRSAGLVEGIETIDGETMLLIAGAPRPIDEVRAVHLAQAA